MNAGCIYCGLPRERIRRGRRIITLPACVAHSDLLALDPSYGLVNTLAREAQPTRLRATAGLGFPPVAGRESATGDNGDGRARSP